MIITKIKILKYMQKHIGLKVKTVSMCLEEKAMLQTDLSNSAWVVNMSGMHDCNFLKHFYMVMHLNVLVSKKYICSWKWRNCSRHVWFGLVSLASTHHAWETCTHAPACALSLDHACYSTLYAKKKQIFQKRRENRMAVACIESGFFFFFWHISI